MAIFMLAAASPRANAASAPTAALIDALAPVQFMVGEWRSDGAGTGPGAGGDSSMQPALSGRALIRRDHVRLRAGGALDILMFIYADGQHLRADFLDTEGHVIHYLGRVEPGPSAVFEQPASAAAPGFRLTYRSIDPGRMRIRFEIAPPGREFRTYTEGDVVRR